MQKVKIIFGLLFLISQLNAQIERPMGINFTGVVDYSTELVFTDAFKQSREWTSFNADASGPWDTEVDIPLNANGYPLEIPYDNGVNPPQMVKALMLWDIEDAVPVGMYRLMVAGTGTVTLRYGASGTYQCPVDTLVEVTGSLFLEINMSDAADPINDIKFIYPEYVNTYDTQTFTDEFLSFTEDFQVFRFMDWLSTNGSAVSTWSDRTPVTNYTQAATNGVAWEYIIELCNLTKKDAWINIPHLADDNYIQQLANLLQNNLDNDVKIYLEYSNELWNGAFVQNYEVADLANSLGYTGQPWEQTWKYTAKRSADIFKIFEDVFTDDSRLVKIMPSQAANSWITNQLITYFNDPTYNPNQVTLDAVAIAPYFGYSVADQIVSDGVVNSITVPEIMTLIQDALAESYTFMSDNKTVADDYNLRLITYEGGQHIVATGSNVNNDLLTEKLIAANRHPDMEGIYCEYFNHWYVNYGDVFAYFSSHARPSKYGSWGVKENMQDVNHPKYLGLKNCVFSYNTIISSAEELNQKDHFSVFPNPTDDGQIFIKSDLDKNVKIMLH
ncbi:MAG TPA: T9SS C-terminal target domain-containing protein, partial [Phaeodactylibacter sp.]|nr:T9SS C-terminal target domain-containing protein [Phaeodactylibacter sp.]